MLTEEDTKSKQTDEFAKLRWQCRRGMLELDRILMNFVDRNYHELSQQAKQSLQYLLTFNDNDLQAWLVTEALPDDPELQDLVMVIRYLHKQQNCAV